MNAFTAAKTVESAAWPTIEAWLNRKGYRVMPVVGSSLVADSLQRECGVDFLVQRDGGELVGVELKCEASNRWGNFFLETWSNKSRGKRRDGWMLTSRADYLFYYFVAEKELYIVDFPQLWSWSFGDAPAGKPGNIYKYPEKLQGKYEQKNSTCGHAVPISVIAANGWCRLYSLA